jgi:hypothetical protein
MNKARRHELKMLHFKRRMKKMRRISPGGNYYAYRSHSTPCSCICCQQPDAAYNRAKEKEKARRMADPISEAVIRSTAIVRQSPFIPEIEGCD